MKERRMMIFRVGQDTMFQLLNGSDFCKYSFESLPEDAVLRDVYHKWEEACFMFRFEHPSFPVCEEGAQAAMSFEGVTITLLPNLYPQPSSLKPPLGPTPEWATQATSKWFLDTQDWAVGFDPDSDEESPLSLSDEKDIDSLMAMGKKIEERVKEKEYQKEVLRKHIEAG